MSEDEYSDLPELENPGLDGSSNPNVDSRVYLDLEALYLPPLSAPEPSESNCDQAYDKMRDAMEIASEQPEDAIAFLTDAIELDPKSATYIARRAKILLGLFRSKAALRDVNHAISLNNSCALAHKVKGKALIELGEYVEATKSLKVALSLDYDEKTAHELKSIAKLVEMEEKEKKEEEKRQKAEKEKYTHIHSKSGSDKAPDDPTKAFKSAMEEEVKKNMSRKFGIDPSTGSNPFSMLAGLASGQLTPEMIAQLTSNPEVMQVMADKSFTEKLSLAADPSKGRTLMTDKDFMNKLGIIMRFMNSFQK
ncbi:hypothetical protein ADUPG1_013519 [Aduncisulcus paluster]|uniref:STI1/HOP DP domain-containing protein n=1 Tax=Aduncisulcus paluster TaxID=2918883 RepID=A0ABQ5K3T4_9EUKA|nr:hypothetical protein ADUPG1_013519 [Aduncisulcus paluster]